MKQGQAQSSKSVSTKVEPTSHSVNVEAVAEIGLQVTRSTSVPLYEGRGLEAPMRSVTTHARGSQGKH